MQFRGIYLLRFGVLREVLGEDAQRRSTHDLSREIFPGMLERSRVAAFPSVEGIQGAGLLARRGHHRCLLGGLSWLTLWVHVS
jgi:hypothetical protein